MPGSSIVSALPSDREQSIASLVTSFTLDPFIRWMLPEPRQYLNYFPEILKHFAGGAFDNASAYRSEDYLGSALWLPPGVSPDEEALGMVMEEGVAPDRLGDAFAVLEEVGESHPEEEHWYLPAIGVDPTCQGNGYGTALLKKGLEVCDRDHVAAYLESTNPLNIPLYQRCGFEVLGKIRAGNSPALIPMLRSAR
jgi:ribosomal protein S18 acetylase RimI-like enzyme